MYMYTRTRFIFSSSGVVDEELGTTNLALAHVTCTATCTSVCAPGLSRGFAQFCYTLSVRVEILLTSIQNRIIPMPVR